MNTLHPTKKSNNAQRGSHTTRPPARATNIRDYRTHRYREHSGSLLTCGRPGRGTIRGSKALRKAIDQVFGPQPVQRWRNHKLRNITGHLPKDQHAQVKSAFRAAMKLEAKQGEQKLEQLARWLEREYPSAAASLREGLSEMFTINRLGLPPRLRKCLSTTNPIDSTHSGVR